MGKKLTATLAKKQRKKLTKGHVPRALHGDGRGRAGEGRRRGPETRHVQDAAGQPPPPPPPDARRSGGASLKKRRREKQPKEQSLKARRRTSSNAPLHALTSAAPRAEATLPAAPRVTPAKAEPLWEGACRAASAVSRPAPAAPAPCTPRACAERARLAERARDRLSREFGARARKAGPAPLLAFERWQLATGNETPTSAVDAGAQALADELRRAGLSAAAADECVAVCAAGNTADRGRATAAGIVKVTEHRHTFDVELVESGRRVGRLFKINRAHHAKLLKLHAHFGEGSFEDDVYRVLSRYCGSAGHGFHAALPSQAFAALRDVGGVSLECFASPLNCFFAPFCSASREDDRSFGSLGSFFEFWPLSGSYECNPPFVEDVLAKAVKHCEALLTASTQPLSFVVVVPGWTDSPAFQHLVRSPHLRGRLVIAAADHGFVDGAQHSRRDRHRASPYDTACFFLQNDQGFKTWPPARTKPALRDAMASGIPTPAEAARRLKAGRGQAPEDGSGGVYKGKAKNRRAAPGPAIDRGAAPRADQVKPKKKKAKKKGKKIPGVTCFM